MTNNLPEFSVINKTDNDLSLQLSFGKDYIFFKGHYPTFPLLPGMIQTHLAIEFAKQELNINDAFTGARSIKFAQPIRPESTIELNLKYDSEKKILQFKYLADEDSFYSKGVLTFQ